MRVPALRVALVAVIVALLGAGLGAVVTRNVEHFQSAGVAVVNPFL